MQIQELRNNLRASYDRQAQARDASIPQEWKIGERSRFLSVLQQENKKRLLEIGAGPGRDSIYFQEQGFEVVCIDLSPAMIELCRQKGLEAYVMDMSRIDFPKNSFDAVYSMNSLLHLTKSEFLETLQRINALLNTDGVMYMGMYGGYDDEGVWENDPYDPKRFFSFFADAHLEKEVLKVFEVLTFNQISFEPGDPLHFQSLILKKNARKQRKRICSFAVQLNGSNSAH